MKNISNLTKLTIVILFANLKIFVIFVVKSQFTALAKVLLIKKCLIKTKHAEIVIVKGKLWIVNQNHRLFPK